MLVLLYMSIAYIVTTCLLLLAWDACQHACVQALSTKPDDPVTACVLQHAILSSTCMLVILNATSLILQDVMGMDTALSSYRNYKLYFITNVNAANMGRIKYVTKQNKRNNLWLSKCLLQGKLVGMGLDKMPKQAEAAAAYAAMKHLNITETTNKTYLKRAVTIK